MKNQSNKIQVADLISIGVYTALYFILVGISALITVFIIPGYSYLFIPVVSALLSGTVFMLMVAKVPKLGAITIMASVMGIFFFVSGRFPIALIPSIVIGFLADLVAKAFNYRSKKGLLLSYIVFAFSNIGPIIPFFLLPEMYIEDLVDRGRDLEYISGAFSNISNYTGIIIVALIFIAAILGGLFGQKMLKKHFVKAGIV